MYQSRVSPKSKTTDVLIRRRRDRDTETDRGAGHVMTDRDWSDASTSQGTPRIVSNPQKLGRGKEGASPLKPSEGAWPCWHFDFQLLASGTVVP